MGLYSQLYNCLLFLAGLSKLGMLGIIKDNFRKYDRVLLWVVADLCGYGWIHRQRPNFFKHWHALVLLNVTSWDCMHHDLETYVFNTWLKARSTNIWYFDEFVLITRYVVPSTVQGYRHIRILAFFKSSWCNHYICVYRSFITFISILVFTARTVNERKIKWCLIKCTL